MISTTKTALPAHVADTVDFELSWQPLVRCWVVQIYHTIITTPNIEEFAQGFVQVQVRKSPRTAPSPEVGMTPRNSTPT
jgi:hypothetical protein